MTTLERIQLLCQTAQAPELLGTFDTVDLKDWITAELGSEVALDQFTPHGPILSKAIAPEHLLHIVSGNTPHGAIQSLLRGLIIGSYNTVKLPSSGLPELELWVKQLAPELQTLIEFHPQLHELHWQRANTVIAIGSDQSIANIQLKLKPHQRFIPHGHKVSIGIVQGGFEEAAALAAKDASLYNQRGCLSPHAIYVAEQSHGQARDFAGMLAKAMQKFSIENPAEPLNLSEAGAVRNLRELTRFKASNSQSTSLWESPGNLAWTVIYEDAPTLKLSCLNRCVYVKPLPTSMTPCSIGQESQYLSSIAIHPFNREAAESFDHFPVSRICPLGQSQQPSLFWHHDGFAPLASLVTWKDIG